MEKQLDMIKLILENDLNRDTIRKLLRIIREITDNVFSHVDSNKILETTGNDMEILKNYYKNIIDSIVDLQP